jgi:hypothetical protein
LYRPVEDLTVGFRVLETLDLPGFGHFHDVIPCFLLRLICVVNDIVYHVWIMPMTATFPSVHPCELQPVPVPSRRFVYERDELFRLRSPTPSICILNFARN